jgi:sialidase-1
MLEFTNVFDTRHDGYKEFRIPVLCVTARGTVLCCAEARHVHHDWGHIDILLRRSTDDGRTFDAPQIISHFEGAVERDVVQLHRHEIATGEGRTNHNAVLIADRSGVVHFLFCIEYRRVFYRRSQDDGLTWSETREISAAVEPMREKYPWRVVATGPNHGIQLRSSRLVVPIWLSRGSEEAGGDHRPSVVSSLYSDDEGQTWHCGDIVAQEREPAHNPNETVAVELRDGRVLFNMRSETGEHRRLIATSPDGATNWSCPHFHPELFEPVCHAGLVRAGDDLVFSNPNPPQGPWHRNNLVIKLSPDDGQTWPVQRVLVPGSAGYCDMGVLPDGTLLCYYEWCLDNEQVYRKDVHTLARFDRTWLLTD